MIGTGILKGMAVTARNFIGSYFEKERLITVQYPEERSPLPENYRNFPFLPYDGDDPHAGLRCVACKICEKECPPQCIYIIKSEDKKPDYMGKPQFYPAVFDIDISVCMSCQICVEVCPFEAIKMDKDFELSKRERFDALLLRKEQLSKSNEYYHRIHPVEAAAVDKNLADAVAAAEAKKKAAAEAAAKAAAAKAAAIAGDAARGPEAKPAQPSPEARAGQAASPTAGAGSTSSPGAAPPSTSDSAATAPPARSKTE
jgi:NADH-quinone oxidoreductase subunit I